MRLLLRLFGGLRIGQVGFARVFARLKQFDIRSQVVSRLERFGFAKGQGIPVEEIEVRETPKGPYCFAHVRVEGRSTRELLAEALPGIVRGED